MDYQGAYVGGQGGKCGGHRSIEVDPQSHCIKSKPRALKQFLYQHSMGPFSIGLNLTPVAMSHKWMVESNELQTKSIFGRNKCTFKPGHTLPETEVLTLRGYFLRL